MKKRKRKKNKNHFFENEFVMHYKTKSRYDPCTLKLEADVSHGNIKKHWKLFGRIKLCLGKENTWKLVADKSNALDIEHWKNLANLIIESEKDSIIS